MSRWKAAAIHLGISLLIVVSLGTILAATWYPPEYVPAAGGLELIGLLAGIDACLGPLLTLIVFKAGKPGLRFDLAAIAALQLLALGYGVHTIFLARPVYMVFAVDRFELVSAVEITPENQKKARREEYRSLPLAGPKIVAVQSPDDPKERERILFSAMAGGADLRDFPQYYLPYSDRVATVLRKARPLKELMAKSDEAQGIVSAYLQNKDLQPTQVKFLPLSAKKRDQAVLVDGTSAAILGIIDVEPW